MKTVADTLGVARSNLAEQAAPTTLRQRRGRRACVSARHRDPPSASKSDPIG